MTVYHGEAAASIKVRTVHENEEESIDIQVPISEINLADTPGTKSSYGESCMTFERTSTHNLPRVSRCPKLLIFIKPWDDDVFINLLKLLSYIERIEQEQEICIEVVMPADLLAQVQAAIGHNVHVQIR
eukprot:CAMPEP_0185592298 /NCGR_PEP_ID=MMETSP0434-20130131/67455_1 /TAXON_ID=626734 ORGANISM="Favella taraikaensis, Strain Fe Narragansett Bay" /NCGR_SAMPLE_ID=MMETSP0434 /ASSEMBLY_ACC=CAM_ASM_000379 /LENGTH=128 /DNA_ID=CAMNT_0028218001 /DNA_START=89 /DNA_END=471 /DNA_ORIENTATION=+